MSRDARTKLPQPPYIGALLRYPASLVHRRIVEGLDAAGFSDFRLPHVAVFQYPGPDGVAPSALAQRAGMSKQAMNQLLQSLEGSGYLERAPAPGDRRARVVRLTDRGRAAARTILATLVALEDEWTALMGVEDFALLKGLLSRLWSVLGR